MNDPTPRAVVMEMLNAAWVCQTVASVTRLDVPDILAKHGPLSARELSEDHGVTAVPEFLERALRACASVGVVSEGADGRFGPTPLSEVLTLDSPQSVKRFAELYGGRWWKSWGSLPEALKTGRPQAPPEESWDEDDPEHLQRFGEAMQAGAVRAIRGLLEHCDLSGARTLVDVGGGFGHVAIALLERHAHLRASVLDVPKLMPIAERNAARLDPEVRARLSFVGGDMFAEVPAGDTYLLGRILHDWDDARCVRVLRNCVTRMPEDGRVLCVDMVLPPLGDVGARDAKFLDLLMMVMLPGKERTVAEWRSLYQAAGLDLASVTRIDPNSLSIVEGTPRGG